MRVEWDRAKNETNRSKHGIDFETAQLVFDDPRCITFVERVADQEDRWHALGSIEQIIILLVGPATRRGRRLYAQAIG